MIKLLKKGWLRFKERMKGERGSWVAVAIGGSAALGAGTSMYLGGKDKGGLQKTSTLNPEQEKMLKNLAPYLTGKIGEGLPAWGGDFTAPTSKYEQEGLGQLGEYMKEGLPETTEFGLEKYRQAMTGMSPEETHDWYMKYVAPQEQRYLKENIIPTIKESMVPGGTLRSTGTEEAISGAVTEFGEGQMGRIGETIMSERAGARGMISQLPAMHEMEAGDPLRKAEAGVTIGALPRLIEQQELTSKLTEFIRTTPELSPVLEMAINLLNTQTQSAYYQQPGTSPFVEIAGLASQGLGAYLGAGGKFGAGKTPTPTPAGG